MEPVRSDPTQPVLASVAPTRLWPPETTAPMPSGPSVPAAFVATRVLRTVNVPLALARPPPWSLAVLPATVQPVSVTLALRQSYNPPPLPAEFPTTVQSVRVVTPPALSSPPPLSVAALPLMVQLVSVVLDLPLGVPKLSMPAPEEAEFPLTVQPVRVVVLFLS